MNTPEEKHGFLACCEIEQDYIQETEKSTTSVEHGAFPHNFGGELYLYAVQTETDTASNVFTENQSQSGACSSNDDTVTQNNSEEHDYTTIGTHSLDVNFDPRLAVTVDGFYKKDFNFQSIDWDSSCVSDTTTTYNRRDYLINSEKLNGVEQNAPWSTLEWSILRGNGSLTTGSDTNTAKEFSPFPWATPLTDFETITGYGSFGSGSDPSPDPGETETSARNLEVAFSTRIDEVFMSYLLGTVDAGAWIPTSNTDTLEPATVTLGTLSSGFDSTASGDILRTRFLVADDSESSFGEYVVEIRDATTPDAGGPAVITLVEEITITRNDEESDWLEIAPPAPVDGFDVSREVVLIKFRTFTNGFWVPVNQPLPII